MLTSLAALKGTALKLQAQKCFPGDVTSNDRRNGFLCPRQRRGAARMLLWGRRSRTRGPPLLKGARGTEERLQE